MEFNSGRDSEDEVMDFACEVECYTEEVMDSDAGGESSVCNVCEGSDLVCRRVGGNGDPKSLMKCPHCIAGYSNTVDVQTVFDVEMSEEEEMEDDKEEKEYAENEENLDKAGLAPKEVRDHNLDMMVAELQRRGYDVDRLLRGDDDDQDDSSDDEDIDDSNDEEEDSDDDVDDDDDNDDDSDESDEEVEAYERYVSIRMGG